MKSSKLDEKKTAQQMRLEEYADLRREIGMMEIRIRDAEKTMLEPVADVVTASQPEYPYLPYHATIIGMEQNEKAYQKLEELRAFYVKRKEVLLEERIEIEKLIASVGSSVIRQIMTYKYVDGLTFQQISFRMGRYDEQWARKKIQRYFEKIRKVRKNDDSM